jgi:hypothetical protein
VCAVFEHTVLLLSSSSMAYSHNSAISRSLWSINFTTASHHPHQHHD